MIAFNIIGRNEGERLRRCIESILNLIEQYKIKDFEIIYVDSKSTDNSIEIAKSFENVKIFQITGKMNAAIGRNIAGKESSADILFFVDGDMELQPILIEQLLDRNGSMKYEFMSGQFENIYYDTKGMVVGKELYHKSVIKEDKMQTTTGGLFVISKAYWEELKGMRTQLKTGEDIDLGLRMAKKGMLLLRKKEIWAKHHTIHYKSGSRMWKDLFKGNTLYARSVLYRTHLLNKHIFKRAIKSDPTAIILMLTIIFTLITGKYIGLLTYALFTFAIIFVSQRKNPLHFLLTRSIYQIIRDLFTIAGFFFFYPRKIKPEYIRIN